MISRHENLVKFAECGMGDMYKTKDLKLNRTVAPKFLASPAPNPAETAQAKRRDNNENTQAVQERN